MSESMQIWMESIFNIAYLIAIWWLVWRMYTRQPRLPAGRRQQTKPFLWAFTLLAIGDTGHVGFRVLAFSLGGLDQTVRIFGRQYGLVGAGALSTAITITFFYMLLLVAWSRRFAEPYDWFTYLLLLAGFARLGYMALPVNQWGSPVPPQPYSLYRNLFLVVQGLGVAYLILKDAAREKDRTYLWVGICILISFAFYLPVILFVQQVPLIGMLMIPKTLAYVAIAAIVYRNLFKIEG